MVGEKTERMDLVYSVRHDENDGNGYWDGFKKE